MQRIFVIVIIVEKIQWSSSLEKNTFFLRGNKLYFLGKKLIVIVCVTWPFWAGLKLLGDEPIQHVKNSLSPAVYKQDPWRLRCTIAARSLYAIIP